jgi:hypothetical protein
MEQLRPRKLNKLVNLSHLFSAFTNDVIVTNIIEICFFVFSLITGSPSEEEFLRLCISVESAPVYINNGIMSYYTILKGQSQSP